MSIPTSKILCPAINQIIDPSYCFEICTVSEGMIKPEVLPRNVEYTEESRRICMNCPYHEE